MSVLEKIQREEEYRKYRCSLDIDLVHDNLSLTENKRKPIVEHRIKVKGKPDFIVATIDNQKTDDISVELDYAFQKLRVHDYNFVRIINWDEWYVNHRNRQGELGYWPNPFNIKTANGVFVVEEKGSGINMYAHLQINDELWIVPAKSSDTPYYTHEEILQVFKLLYFEGL